MPDENVGNKLLDIRLLVMDVDGVLTDGGVIYSSERESKRFHVSDGLGIQLAMHAGLVIAWITGRKSEAVERRAKELGVHHLYQGAANKSVPMAELLGMYAVGSASVAYIGDDVNDLPAFSVAGVKFAPANAAAEIKGIADFVTQREGGAGAVREVCDTILKAQGRYNDALTRYLARLLQPEPPPESPN